MMFPALLITLSILPPCERTGLAVDACDRVEVNHVFDECGRSILDQVVFYDWDSEQGRYQVRAWRLLKSPAQVPQKNFQTGEYEIVWHDGDTLRRVRAKSFCESWTQHDVELRDRDVHAKSDRRELSRPAEFQASQPSEADLSFP